MTDAKNDYPAAHSMDTWWFAVDNDGHVGLFFTGEAGALPSNAEGGYDTDLLEEITLLEVTMPRRLVVIDQAGFGLPHMAKEEHHLTPFEERHCVIFLDSLEPVRDLIKGDGVVQAVHASVGAAIECRGMSQEDFNSIHERNLCKGCYWYHGAQGGAELGLFVYDHLTENWIAGPYGRVTRPSHPLKVDDLPENLAKAVGKLKLDLCFVDTPHIQPCEHTECHAWGSEYMELETGESRPLPYADFDGD